MSFQFWHGRESTVLSVILLFQLQCGEEGHAPSSWCLHSNFDAVRMGMPLLIVLLPFQCDKEGLPLLVILLPFQCDKLLVVSLFEFQHSEEEHALPHCVVVISMQQGGPTPPCCLFVLILTWRGEYAPPCHVISLISRR